MDQLSLNPPGTRRRKKKERKEKKKAGSVENELGLTGCYMRPVSIAVNISVGIVNSNRDWTSVLAMGYCGRKP